jgi:hypothetical protein
LSGAVLSSSGRARAHEAYVNLILVYKADLVTEL